MTATVASTTAPTTAAAGTQKKYQIALIVKNLVNPFWVMMKDGAEKEAAKLGVTVTTYAPTKADNVEEQIKIMEDLINKKIDGFIVVAADAKGIVPGIEKANAANIPVAMSNSNTAGGKYITFSAIENYDAMKLVAQYMVKQLNGKGKIIILDGVAGAQSIEDRKRAIADVLKENPGIEVLAQQTALNQRAEGMKVMENLLVRFPQIDWVIAENDEMALGAVQAIEAAGRQKEIKVSGFDANDDAVKAVNAGKMIVTANQRPDQQASKALDALVDYLNGKKDIPERIKIDITLIDTTNVKDLMKERNLQ
jgi:ABC-type sugar transport system substrate-binding protein